MGTHVSTPRSWIGWSLIAGCTLGVPAGCLLAYLAVLPLLLGLFFFLVVGLVVGAVMFRLGHRAGPTPKRVREDPFQSRARKEAVVRQRRKPLPDGRGSDACSASHTPSKASLWLIGAAVVLVIWGTGLVVEYLGFPQDATRAVLKSLPQRLTPEQRAELRVQTRRHVLARFAGSDSAGGALASVRGLPAYLRWAATDGTIECPRVFNDSTHTVTLPQRRVAWLVRVTVSLALLAFTILSQFLSLRRTWEPVECSDGAAQLSGDCETGRRRL